MSYQHGKSHCGDKTIVRSSYLHNGISYTSEKYNQINPLGPNIFHPRHHHIWISFTKLIAKYYTWFDLTSGRLSCRALVWLNWVRINNLVQTEVTPVHEKRGYVSIALAIWCYQNKEKWSINTMRPRQNGRHFADDIFKCIFLKENAWILIKISLKFVPKGPIDKIPALVQIMAWRRSGDKPLSELMMISLLTHLCITLPQWVNSLAPGRF